eukprot:TRINITY_DN65982_c0_g1_i1.p1 TRINITY_DN65982_c0_g1~~TRINITY_DN65982_c0_g1_i1.p1  ORF type:complete len:138 (+),score=37.74 TRINITY_DN65982_c0_g1_i1:115-528(+)
MGQASAAASGAAGGSGGGAAASSSSSAPEALASQPAGTAEEKAEGKQPWLPPGSFALDPNKPHRKASNSCTRIREDMLQCYEKSRCYKEGAPFEECINSEDADYVGADCIWLRKGYAQCRRDLLNRNRIWQRGNRAA